MDEKTTFLVSCKSADLSFFYYRVTDFEDSKLWSEIKWFINSLPVEISGSDKQSHEQKYFDKLMT